jgi:hypothetical protein
MDRETLLALGERLKRYITFEESLRIGMILPQILKSEGCDHTLTRTADWLKEAGRDVDADVRWLKERGGDCDCKVLTNVIGRMDAEV